MKSSFHLALPAADLNKMHYFYSEALGLSCQKVVVKNIPQLYIDFFGNNLAFEYTDQYRKITQNYTMEESSAMDLERYVKFMHFGVYELSYPDFDQIIKRLKSHQTTFLIQPTLFNKDEYGEQIYTFIQDPEGYIIELRAFKNIFHFEKITDYLQQREDKVAHKLPL